LELSTRRFRISSSQLYCYTTVSIIDSGKETYLQPFEFSTFLRLVSEFRHGTHDMIPVPTILCEFCAAQFIGSNKLFPQLAVAVHKHRRQVLVGVVRNAHGRYTLQELGRRELGRQRREILLDQLAFRYATSTNMAT